MNEGLKREQNTETHRANVMKEGQTNRALAETYRHNRATEKLGIANAVVSGVTGLGHLLV